MKRTLCCLLSLVLCLTLWGCQNPSELPPETTEAPESHVPTTTAAPTEATETTQPSETEPSTEPVPTQTQTPTLSWTEGYAQLLQKLRQDDPMPSREYCLYDINGDNIPEFFYKTGSCEADFMIHLYAMSDYDTEMIATLSGSHSGLCGLSGQNACLLVYGIQGHEQIIKLTFTGTHLHQETIYEAFGEEYHDFSYLPLYNVEQREGLHWDGNPEDQNQAALDNYNNRFPYLLQIPFADHSVFSGPSYDERFVQTMEAAGTYTIVDEQWDNEGNLWGKLKSGAGWINLSELEYRIYADEPISANYADRPVLQNPYEYFYDAEGGAEYGFSVAFRAYEELTDVRFCRANLAAENGLELTELCSLGKLTPEKPFVADVYFPGDMSAYAIVFYDSEGIERIYILTTNGRNNALTFYQY